MTIYLKSMELIRKDFVFKRQLFDEDQRHNMKKGFYKIINVLVVGAALFILGGCSQLKKEPPVAPPQNESQVHENGWNDVQSENFHGLYIRTTHWSLQSCSNCHGKDYAGGTAGVTCNNSNCHSGTPEACTTCHGGSFNTTGAPPVDLNHQVGGTTGVGAHTLHVSENRWGGVYDCQECHLKPEKLLDTGHIDSDLPAEVVWGAFANAANLSPIWDGMKCINVYCHGASLAGGKNKQPKWILDAMLSCDACHGLPPETGAHVKHVQTYQFPCAACHEGFQANSMVNKAIHINTRNDVTINALYGGLYTDGFCSDVGCHGSLTIYSWTGGSGTSCTSCHGGVDNMTGAPPKDVSGNSSATVRGVGAHTAHVGSLSWSRSFNCTECHLKPSQVGDAGHLGSSLPAEIQWGSLASVGSLSPQWNGTTCANVYCHGASLKGGSNTAPSWTAQQSLSCNSCHGTAPKSGEHEEHKRYDCNICHEGYQKNSAVNLAKHIDGNKYVQFGAGTSGNYSNGLCSGLSCHGSKKWFNG